MERETDLLFFYNVNLSIIWTLLFYSCTFFDYAHIIGIVVICLGNLSSNNVI